MILGRIDAYDMFGNRIVTTDALGNTVFKSYDPFGRVVAEWGATYPVCYAYDTQGRRTSLATTRDGIAWDTTTWAYDAATGLCLSKTYADGSSVTYTYTPDNFLLRTTYASGRWRENTYDTSRRLVAENFGGGSGGAGGSPAETDTFGYNARSEVVSATIAGGAPSPATAYYGYDEIGNSTNWPANCLNQYTLCGSMPPCEFSYDLDGNMLSDGDLSLTYDAAHRLASVSSNDAVLATFAYDAQGRRVRKVTPTATHLYFYDGWNLVRETLVTHHSSLVTDYVWGKDLSGTLQGAGSVGGLLYLVVSNSNSNSNSQLQLYIPFYDNNGNVTLYCDAQGSVVASFIYDAFGNIISQSGPMADDFAFRFSTKYYDRETGLYYYGCRYYHPTLMRWINRDPIEEDGGENLYAFCGNNGINRLDSLGEDWHVTRRHLPFAEAKRDNVYKDTIYKLSQEIDLDPMEAMRWARKDMSGSRFSNRNELEQACRIYIPNRISLMLPEVTEVTYRQALIPFVGYYFALRMQNMIFMRNRLREISEMYYDRGYSIDSLDY